MVGGRVEERRGAAVQRDVKVDAPFGGLGTPAARRAGGGDRPGLRKGDIEILVADQGAIRAALDDLMEVDVVREGPEGVADWDDDRTVVVLALPDDDATSDRPVSGSSTSTRA